MPVEILMPELGESVHEATVTRWIVKEGDTVKEDDPVVEIMTDKVNTELPAPVSGVLTKIIVPEGGTVHVFAPMGVIEETGAPSAKPAAKPAESASEAAKPVVAPTPVAAPAPQAPVVEDSRAAAAGRTWYSPVVRSMAKENRLSDADLENLRGTGPGGRVTKKDMEDFLAANLVGGAARPSAPPAPEPTYAPISKPAASFETKAAPATAGPDQEIKQIAPMRKMIAEAMLKSAAVPTVTTIVQIDVTSMVRFREANKDSFQAQYGVKLTYTPFFIKALTEGLQEFPTVNGSLQGDQVVINRAVHMGIAVALGSKGDEGLIVPVIRDCHKKGLVELSKELEAIAAKSRTNALSPSDVQGGTFTLSNPGSYGALFGTPMIVAPQAAIAGAYGIQKLPVVMKGDMIAIRSMMYFALTYDHRIIDGLLAGRFLQAVKTKLEGFDFFA